MQKQTLWRTWLDLADADPNAEAVVHWNAGEDPFRWRRAELLAAASRYASALAKRGVKPGEVCATVIRHHRDFYPLYLGISALGALPAVLAYPNARLHPAKFRDGLVGMTRRSGLDWLLVERDLEPIVRPLTEGAGSTIRELLFPLEWNCGDGTTAMAAFPEPAADPDLPSLLQHSSGTTGLQKPVMLSHRAVLEHVRGYGKAIDLRSTDRVVSWLPLYHDMGLIAAFHLPLAAGIPTVQINPFEWVAAPILLIDAISAERGTLTWLPNFAYNLLADRCRDDEMEGLHLGTMRMFINCSEPVRAESHRRFLAKFESYGVTAGMLAACYAMAETTFAATQTAPGEPSRVIDASSDALSRGVFRAAGEGEAVRTCVSSGRPIDGCVVEVVDDKRQPVESGHVGELRIRSTAMFDGYRHYPEKTAEVLDGGWYYSGDYGFLDGGECFVIGRRKDIVIIAGKNIYPEDVEDLVGKVEGVLPGRVVAFGIDDENLGTEQLCVVAETRDDSDAAKQQLTRAIIEAAMQIDITVSRVYLVPPRWLVKSSSGKPSRSGNRTRVLEELASAPADRIG